MLSSVRGTTMAGVVSGGGSLVVQRSAQAFSLPHCRSLTDARRIPADHLVVEALMIALGISSTRISGPALRLGYTLEHFLPSK